MSNAENPAKVSKPLISRPKVFIDADVLIAGSASTRGASHIVLQLSELTVIEGVISLQVKREAERNLQSCHRRYQFFANWSNPLSKQ